jgi:hypothetical protein
VSTMFSGMLSIFPVFQMRCGKVCRTVGT